MGRPPLAVGTSGAVTVRRDGQGWKARAYVRDADGRRREVARWRPTKAAAEAALKIAMRDRNDLATDAGGLTPESRVAQLAELWLDEIDRSSKAVQTKRLYRIAAESNVVPALGGLRLRELTVPRVDAALRAISANNGPGAAKTARSALSGMLGLAARHGAVSSNPVRDASAIDAGPRKGPRALTVEEEERVRDAPRSSARALELDVPDLIDWMLGTGVRIGEACAVRRRGLDGRPLLDLEAGTVEINATIVRVKGVGLVVQERPKTAAGWRVLALPDDLVAMLRRRDAELRLRPSTVLVLDEQGTVHEVADPGIVFTSPRGHVRDPKNTNDDLAEVLAAIDRQDGDDVGPFGWVTSHLFRKTVATRLDDAGLSARQIADVLGHSKPSMTQDVYMGRKVVSAAAAVALARPIKEAAR